MESTFVWIVMFAGAAVALLGVFLVASERELKVKRREIEALLARLENTPQGSTATQSIQSEAEQAAAADLRAQNRNLQNELNAITSELDQSRNTIDDLRNSQQNSTNSHIENQQLSAANDRLSREVTELRSRLSASEAQIHSPVSQSRDEQEAYAQMQAELDELRQTLNESQSKIRELERARQNLPDVNVIEAAHRQERESLQQRIAELAQEVSHGREKLAELQTLRDRLAETENIQNSLRDEIRRHENEIPRWQARLAAGDESRQRLAALQVPCNELLSKQAALADRQRQLQEELMAFARLIAAPGDATEQANRTSAAKTDGSEEPNASPQPSSARPISSGNFSSTLEAAPELRAAQNVTVEPTSNTTPAAPSGRRYGILGALLFIAAAGVFGLQLLVSDSEQASYSTATTKTPERSAPTQLSEPALISKAQEPSVETSRSRAPRATAQSAPAIRENPAPAIIDNQTAKAERAALGTYRVIRTTRVYAAPNEISRSIGDIEPGINVTVVDAREGWLEIHSKHGRPPGFIRRDTAARVTGRN